MRTLKLKLTAIWLLLTSKGCVLMYAKNQEAEELDAGFIFYGMDAEQIILFCDTLADSLEEDLKREEDELMSERLGNGMSKYINEIHLN